METTMKSDNPLSSNEKPLDKVEIWHRLEKEGRLTEFNARREKIRREHRESGLKRREAAEKAWRVAINDFNH